MKRRSFLRSLPLAAMTLAPNAFADPGALSFYVPFPAGGVSDVMARVLAPGMAKVMKRTVLVENITGASGSIAASRFLSKGATGDALFLGSPTEVILAPLILESAKYKATDFTLVHVISKPPLGVFVRADFPADSIDELVVYLRKHRHPASYGSVGIGSLYHLAGDALRRAADVDLTHIPYRGGNPVLQDLMGGQLDMAFLPVDGLTSKIAAGGKMRLIGVAGASRSPLFPHVGTFAESRLLPTFTTVELWIGVFVSSVLSNSTIANIHRGLQENIATVEVKTSLEQAAGVALAPNASLAQLAAFFKSEIQRFHDAAAQIKLMRM